MALSFEDVKDIIEDPLKWARNKQKDKHRDRYRRRRGRQAKTQDYFDRVFSRKYDKIKQSLVGAWSTTDDVEIIERGGIVLSSTGSWDNFEGLRSRMLFRDDSTGDGRLYRVALKGDAVLRAVNNRTRVELVSGTDNIDVIPAEFIYDSTNAQKYASQEANKIKFGDFEYSWSSPDDVEVGSFVNLQVADPSINTQVQITGKDKNKEEPLYNYTGRATAEFNLETVIRKGDTYFTPSQLAFFTDSSVRNNVVTIAASDYYYPANRRCDGTADQVEINAAITKLSSESGGGVVKLSPGTFYLSAAIELADNILLEGAGAKTVVDQTADSTYIIDGLGSPTEFETISIANMKLTISATTKSSVGVDMAYSDKATVNNIIFEDCGERAIRFIDVGYLVITECKIKQFTYAAMVITNCSGVVSNNEIDFNSDSGSPYGIELITSSSIIIKDNLIHNSDIPCFGIRANTNNTPQNVINISGNVIKNFVGQGPTIYAITESTGIRITADNVILSYNTIENVNGLGIEINSGAENTIVRNNTCRNNGNLIDRGNCESTTAPMVQGETVPVTERATWARDSGQAYEGTYSYKLTATTDTLGEHRATLGDSDGTADLHGLIAGLTYKLFCYVYTPTTGGPSDLTEVTFRYGSYSGSWTFDVKTDLQSSYDTWELFEYEFTVPSGATAIRLAFRMPSTVALNEYFYVDNIRLQPIGVNNEHDQQFVDSGTDTQVNINSWQ